MILFLMSTGCATSAEVGSEAVEDLTRLEALPVFHDCVGDAEVQDGSLQEFWIGGILGMSDASERALVEDCLASSGYGNFVSPTGEVTIDDDFIRVANEYAKARKACIERKGWPQDELVFDEEGWLVPDGSGPTLSNAESQRYIADSYACGDEIGDPVEDVLNGEPLVTVPTNEGE